MCDALCEPAPQPIGESFEQVVLPHLDAAYRLARWLIRDEHDAEDVVQEASLRAFRYFRTFTGGNGRAWFLRIVRNCCRDWAGHSVGARDEPFDELRHRSDRPPLDPEMLLLRTDGVALIDQALMSLPDRFRELLVLRELEGLTYRELAPGQLGRSSVPTARWDATATSRSYLIGGRKPLKRNPGRGSGMK